MKLTYFSEIVLNIAITNQNLLLIGSLISMGFIVRLKYRRETFDDKKYLKDSFLS
ncbi:hypothetical protein KKP97_06505 [Methanothermococcus sp. SCGC AD-155-C09]|nr:hypothetical protein [Methanothermococcus sp. SCGC AD-155-C09]